MEIGQKLPDYLGVDQDGKEVRTSYFKGKNSYCTSIPKTPLPDAPRRHAICAIITASSLAGTTL